MSREEVREPIEGAGYAVASLDGLGEGYGFRKIRRGLGEDARRPLGPGGMARVDESTVYRIRNPGDEGA